MNAEATTTIQDGEFPHVKWIDIKGNGVLKECAVMKIDEYGNVFFFELAKLDNVDKRRLFNIITSRTSTQFELWDLLSQKTLGNGMNALTYFHQLVRVLTPSGKVINPRQGEIGFGQGRQGVVDTNKAS